MINIEVSRVHGDFGFEAKDANGHIVRFDNSPKDGGTNFGVSPMQVLLMGLGSCTGMDVVTILKKQKQEIKTYHTHINGEREHGKEPSVWKKIKLIFDLEGDIEPEKAKRAVQLSMEKYCSVAETLRRAGAAISFEVKVNGKVV